MENSKLHRTLLYWAFLPTREKVRDKKREDRYRQGEGEKIKHIIFRICQHPAAKERNFVAATGSVLFLDM